MRLFDALHAVKASPWLAWPLAAGNLVAVYYGWSDYYAAQFEATPWYLWPFVSDSPNAVLLFAASLLLYRLGVRWAWLDVAAFIANVKVGLWTVFVLLYYYEGFFDEDPGLRWFLLWLHVGMVGQAFVLHRDLRNGVAAPVLAAVAALFLAHDALDYGAGTHPYLPGPVDGVVVATTVALTLAASAWTVLRYRRIQPGTRENHG